VLRGTRTENFEDEDKNDDEDEEDLRF